MTSQPPSDPYSALTYALSCATDSSEQVQALSALRQQLEQQPATIPVLCPPLLQSSLNAADSLFKRWSVDLFRFAVSSALIHIDVRTQLAFDCFDVAIRLLNDPNPPIVKSIIQSFSAIYPLLFRLHCATRSNRQQWESLTAAKRKIVDYVENPTTSAGVRLSALKFLQRAMLVQTRGVTDPRLQNKADPNLSFCPSDHPYISVTALEAEGGQFLTLIITLLYNSQNSDVICAIVNTFGALAKMRPAFVQILIPTLTAWTPARLAGQLGSNIKSVEKSVHILLTYIARTSSGQPHVHEINEALHRINNRMQQAAREEQTRRSTEAQNKRTLAVSGSDVQSDQKRIKLDPSQSTSTSVAGPSQVPKSSDVLANLDYTELPVNLVADLVIANLNHFSLEAMTAAIATYRVAHPELAVSDVQNSAPVKDEPLDPLQLDIGEDEMEYEPDLLNMELEVDGPAATAGDIDADTDDLAVQLRLSSFDLPPPKDLSATERKEFLRASISRLCAAGEMMNNSPASVMSVTKRGAVNGLPSSDMWMLLLVRMVTRGPPQPVSSSAKTENSADATLSDAVDKKGKGRATDLPTASDDMKQALCDYIVVDFSARVRLATLWMNEEWYNDRLRGTNDPSRRGYEIWLQRILDAHVHSMDAGDKTLSHFLLDLPTIPKTVLDQLRDLCINSATMSAGFSTLRELVSLRPPLRSPALEILLDLTTHPEKLTRVAAINTVKRWVPDNQPMDGLTRKFALGLLNRLKTRRKPEARVIPVVEAEDTDMDGSTTSNIPASIDAEQQHGDVEAETTSIDTPYLPETLSLPAQPPEVLQHVQLLFALSVKVPQFLDEIFMAYGQMDDSVQKAMEELLTPLIRSLGPNHGKLLTLLRTFPPGAESLALRVLTILTESGRPSSPLVALVKALIQERDLDARFLIPIIAEMDKVDIIRHLPRIISTLNGKPEAKQLVRSVFQSVIDTPPESFGNTSSNLPRVRQSELLMPAELLVLLHESEMEIGLKSAIEAIGICFSMTDVFSSQIFAIVMQQIVDNATLPVLFMRTVIQAVTTYKGLIGFVAGTLLSRLITKKIWTNPHLWAGFIHCAKAIAPASFGALLQLPKEQLREIVDKVPSLRSGLREHVIKKGGPKSRILEILGGEETEGAEVFPVTQPSIPVV